MKGAQVRQVYSVKIDSISGSPAGLRLLTHRTLLAEGLSVRDIAACDCLIVADPMLGIASQPVEVRIHIIRVPGGSFVRNTILLTALIGSPGDAIEATGPWTRAAPTGVVALLERIRGVLQRSKLPVDAR